MSGRPSWWLTVLAKIWPLTWKSARATKWPVVGPLLAKIALPLFSGKNLNVSYIPINREISSPGSSPLAITIVEDLIRVSSHRTIIHRCTCRDAKKCANHPVEYGCIHLGDGTKEEDTTVACHVSVDEAIEHARKAVKDGLIPMIGRVRIDNLIWGVRDRGKLLTLCFCCRCCCTNLASGKYLPQKAADSFVRLKGTSLTVSKKKCNGCGICVGECFMGAISIMDGIAIHDESKCKACGRCATVCPENAVRISISNRKAAVEELLGRIDGIIDYKKK
jgi:ferredoxin